MTEFIFHGPGGKTITVTGPEGATQNEAIEVLQQQHPELWDTPASSVAADIGKSAVSGAAKAPLHVPGFLGDLQAAGEGVGEWISRKIVGDKSVEEAKQARKQMPSLTGTAGAPTTSDIARGVENVTGAQFHQPETTAGRYVGAATETMLDPLSIAMGPGGVARRLATGALSGASGELGGDVAGPVGSVVASGGTSLATSRMAGSAQRAAARAVQPTEPQIRGAAQQAYDTARQMNVPLPRYGVMNLGQQIRQNLVSQFGFRPFNEPKTFAAIRLLEEPANMSGRQLSRRMGTTGASSSSEILSIRDTLNNIRRNNPGTSEARAAGEALDHIDNYLNNIPGLNDVTRQARGDYRAAERASDLNIAVDEAIRDAQARGGSVANNLRAKINRIIDNDRLPKTPDEEAAMRKIVGGGGLPQEMAKLGPNHWLWGLWAALHGHLLHGAALITPGTVGRRMDAARTTQSVQDLRDQILRNAPSGFGPALPPQWPVGSEGAAIVRATDALSQQQTDDALR